MPTVAVWPRWTTRVLSLVTSPNRLIFAPSNVNDRFRSASNSEALALGSWRYVTPSSGESRFLSAIWIETASGVGARQGIHGQVVTLVVTAPRSTTKVAGR